MINESNKTKSNSQTKNTFYEVVEQVPIIGKPIRNLLKRKESFREKLGAIVIIMIAGVIGVLCYYWRSDKQKLTQNQNATRTGNNSPIANQLGNNNLSIQNSSNTIVNIIDTNELFKKYEEQMKEIKRLQDDELRRLFNIGYILFTATENRAIVPFGGPMNDILTVDWKSDYKVSFSNDDNTISFKLPCVKLHYPSNSYSLDLMDGNTVIKIHKQIEPFARPGLVLGNYRLAFKVVSINNDSVIIAMGVQSPPPPIPSMEELKKYGSVGMYIENMAVNSKAKDSNTNKKNSGE